MERRAIRIENIHVGGRLRPLDMAKVRDIAESVREIGLMNPPSVRIVESMIVDGEEELFVPVLIAGHHRVEAMKLLGEEAVECAIYSVNDDDAELMEIDENLKRADLSPAQEADHIRRRQMLWEKKHGPAKAVGGRASAAAQGRGVATENISVAFTTETAAATGKTDRAVRMAAARARELGDDIKRVAGTSLDKGVELDALVKLPSDERAPLIARAVAGEQVSARPTQDPKDAQRARFWRMWASLDEDVRQAIMADFQAGRVPAP